MNDYSVAIRTLGKSGDKYRKLLDSIRCQTLQPKEIFVVLPNGCEKPKYQLGYEKYIFTERSMILQRLRPINEITSKYILFCDDDIEMAKDFSEILIMELEKDEFQAASGPLIDFFPPKSLKYLLASILGGACVMIHGRNKYYTRILKTGGWSYNRSISTDMHKVYCAESLAWTCFMIKKEVMESICFEDELWIEKNGYAAYDDRVMFYKLLLNGFSTCVVSDAHYIHNDAKTSTKHLEYNPLYNRLFNHFVFWHRFIYNMENNLLQKMWSKVCISYYKNMQYFYYKFLPMIKKNNEDLSPLVKRAFRDAENYVDSEAYLKLNSVKKDL